MREELQEKINLWKRISKPPEKKQKGWGGFSLYFLEETEKEAIRSEYLLKAIDHMEGKSNLVCAKCGGDGEYSRYEGHDPEPCECRTIVFEHPQPLNQWISVKDQLPEIIWDDKKDFNVSEPVLGLMGDGEICTVKNSHWYEDDKDQQYFFYTYDGELCEQITHWMPLPEPPTHQ